MQTKQFLTPADVALELNISTSTVLRKIHAREILKTRVFPLWLFRGSQERLDLLKVLLHGGK